MRNILMAGAAALAMLLPATLSAQSTGQTSSGSTTTSTSDQRPMTRDQQTMHDSWPAERQTMYSGMSSEMQEYYWTLMPEQQEAYWLLNDDQRQKIASQSPEQQAMTWNSIRTQMGSAHTARSGTSTMSPAGNAAAMPGSVPRSSTTMGSATARGNVNYVSNPVMQNIPAPHQGEYPPCRGDQKDNCVNPREMSR